MIKKTLSISIILYIVFEIILLKLNWIEFQDYIRISFSMALILTISGYIYNYILSSIIAWIPIVNSFYISIYEEESKVTLIFTMNAILIILLSYLIKTSFKLSFLENKEIIKYLILLLTLHCYNVINKIYNSEVNYMTVNIVTLILMILSIPIKIDDKYIIDNILFVIRNFSIILSNILVLSSWSRILELNEDEG